MRIHKRRIVYGTGNLYNLDILYNTNSNCGQHPHRSKAIYIIHLWTPSYRENLYCNISGKKVILPNWNAVYVVPISFIYYFMYLPQRAKTSNTIIIKSVCNEHQFTPKRISKQMLFSFWEIYLNTS